MGKNKITRSKTFLLILGVTFLAVIIGAGILPFLSLIILSILNIFLKMQSDPSIPIAIIFIWSPIIGAIIGGWIGIKISVSLYLDKNGE